MTNQINTFDINNFSFTYAGSESPSLENINFSIRYGEFITLCGKTGSGKSTLLRNFKPVLAPEGERTGTIEFYGRNINNISDEEQARRIGFVLQDPENQIVTDKVWHELAFGLENLGVETNSIRIRVAEMATFFGISPWINKDIATLSGGQKQLINLASVMTMNPDVLILDEPTASLDPIASEEFINTLIRINKEIGTTVIISEHDLNQVMSESDRVIVMEKCKVAADAKPEQIGNIMSSKDRDFILSMPVPLQVYMSLKNHISDNIKPPLTVREGRDWLTEIFRNVTLSRTLLAEDKLPESETVLKLKDIRFKYGRDGEDVIKNLDIKIGEGQVTTIAGGNGAGKSTLLRVMGGLLKPYKGKVWSTGSQIVLLPQNPQALFACDSVEKELKEVINNYVDKPDEETIEKHVDEICKLMELEDLRKRHAYDLSGGEQQRVAFAKVLLTRGDIYLLDEPTTGLDGANKKLLGKILKQLSDDGKTIVIVTHDLEFAAEYSHRCLLLFDGQIMSSGTPHTFFSDNSYYTTSGNRMSRHIFANAVTPEDIEKLCRINLENNNG